MISALKWVPRGAAAETPLRADLDEAEMSRISELAKKELIDAEDDLAAVREEQANPPKVEAEASGADDDDELKEYNMSDYDNDLDEERENTIAGVQGLAYYGPEEEDEYLTLPTKEDQEEEEEELRIRKTDNMLLAAKTEDDISLLEVHVYDDSYNNLYVHHDMMLPSFPLCLEWIPITPGSESKPGNFAAVGTFEPEIELWNLDLVDAMFPAAILGKSDRPEAKPLGTGKKKRKLKTANDSYHVDAVLSLSSNPAHANLLASGSADTTVKLWDLQLGNTEKAAQSLNNYHTSKVSSIAWNPVDATVLLSGGYDSHARVGDMRSGNIKKDSRAYAVTGDVENVQWSHDGVYFYAGTDRGQIYKFDAREAKKPVWQLQAHDSEITSFGVNRFIDDLLVTASSDHQVKLWNIKEDRPSMVLSRDFDVGKVFSISFGPEHETRGLLSVAGSEGKLKVWDALTNKTVRNAFTVQSKGTPSSGSEERVITADSDSDEDESDRGEVDGDEFE